MKPNKYNAGRKILIRLGVQIPNWLGGSVYRTLKSRGYQWNGSAWVLQESVPPATPRCQVCGQAVEPMLSHCWYGEGFVFCDQHASEAGYCPACGDYMASTDMERASLAQHGVCTECLIESELGD